MPCDFIQKISAEMIVIPMAGESSRFKKAGYTQPKFMLPLDGKPLFDWTVLSFSRYFSSETFLFIARNTPEIKSFLQERIAVLGLQKSYCIFLDHPTRGQAETVYLGLQELRSQGVGCAKEPITIFNIDTIRPQITFPRDHQDHAWLEVFKTQGDNWSFVLPEADGTNVVKRCSEKLRISDYCCTGLYSFKDADQFARAYHAELKQRSSHELFIAPMYNHLIDGGEVATWFEVASREVLLSGVPQEYEALKKSSISGLM